MTQDNANNYQIPAGMADGQASADDILRHDVYSAYANNANFSTEPSRKKPESIADEKLNYLISICGDIEDWRTEKIAKLSASSVSHINTMGRFFKNVSELMFSRKMPYLSNEEIARNQLISKESKIGAQVFGLTSSKHDRYEFFYEGREERDGHAVYNWFFHEDRLVDKDTREARTMHYEILPMGVFLVGSGYLVDKELDKFMQAIKLYHSKVKTDIYSDQDLLDLKTEKAMSPVAKKIAAFIDRTGLGGGNLAA